MENHASVQQMYDLFSKMLLFLDTTLDSKKMIFEVNINFWK